jgi:peptidoglycan/LPS O-acetylase OafA/YrhL
MKYYQEHQIWFWTYLQNWPLIFKDDSGASVLNHYWSLAIEEQYYLIWPLIILLLKKPRKVFILSILLLVLVIAARFYIWQNRNDFPSYERAFLFTRVDGLLIGAMLASLYNINSQLLRKYFTSFLLVLTALNYGFYLFKKNQSPDFPVWAIAGFTTFSLLFAMVVYEAAMKENKFINFILSNSILRFLGKYSYGFYIFHWPVALLLSPWFYNITAGLFEKNNFLHLLITGTLSTLAGLLVSIVCYHAIEKHFLKLKKHFT